MDTTGGKSPLYQSYTGNSVNPDGIHRQQPKRQVTPALQFIISRERAISGDIALMVEGSNASVPGDDMYHANNGWSLKLPEIDPYGPESR